MSVQLPPVPPGNDIGSALWKEWFTRLQNILSGTGTTAWTTIDFTGSDITDIRIRSHEDLQSMLGGAAGDHYHLTGAENTLLTGTKSANTFLAGPTSGTAALATFRVLTAASADFANQGTTTTVLHGNAAGNPSWGAVVLTTDVSGILPIANGGTNSTSTPTAGAIGYGTGTAIGYTLAGTTGQVLTSQGSGTPTWTTLTVGTVTSVSFTGGLITVGTATTTPAFTVAGTSGGIPYFSSASTWATSAALVASNLVVGGGAGLAPATTTTGTGVVTALGVNTGTAGAFVVNGGALGSPSTVGTLPAYTLGGTISGGGNQINNVIIGTTTPLAGTFTALTCTSLTNTSDERLKANIQPFRRGLKEVSKIKPISYTFLPKEGLDPTRVYAGLSAQNVLLSIPEAVISNAEGYLGVSDMPLIAALINSVNELNDKLERSLWKTTTRKLVSGFRFLYSNVTKLWTK